MKNLIEYKMLFKYSYINRFFETEQLTDKKHQIYMNKTPTHYLVSILYNTLSPMSLNCMEK